jgi:hypothetical protein
VTVPVEEAPPAIEAGRKLTEEGVGGRMGSVEERLTPNAVAVIWAVTRELTGAMVRANVPVVEPEGTTTEAGTVAVALRSEESPTVNPEGGAGALIVTVPVHVPPPPTGFGLTEKPVSLIAATVSGAEAELVPTVAETFAVTSVPPVWVVLIEKVVEFELAGTVTVLLTVAEEESEASLTDWPPTGAGAESVTVPVEEYPP